MIETHRETPLDVRRARRGHRFGTRGKLLTALVVGLLSATLIIVGVPAMLFGGWWMPPGFALASLGALGLSWTFKLLLGTWDK